MVDTEIRWIIFFEAKDGALYSQQKQEVNNIAIKMYTIFCVFIKFVGIISYCIPLSVCMYICSSR